MRRRYRRSRTDYPAGVLAVYDNGGRTADRYTVVYEPYQDGADHHDWFPTCSMSAAPFHPQGVCMHGELAFRPTGGWGTHMKVITFEALPADCQRAVRRDLQD